MQDGRRRDNMTDKPAAVGRPDGRRTPASGRQDAGDANIRAGRKNAAEIGRRGRVCDEKPSQVCGQQRRRRRPTCIVCTRERVCVCVHCMFVCVCEHLMFVWVRVYCTFVCAGEWESERRKKITQLAAAERTTTTTTTAATATTGRVRADVANESRWDGTYGNDDTRVRAPRLPVRPSTRRVADDGFAKHTDRMFRPLPVRVFSFYCRVARVRKYAYETRCTGRRVRTSTYTVYRLYSTVNILL